MWQPATERLQVRGREGLGASVEEEVLGPEDQSTSCKGLPEAVMKDTMIRT